MTEPERERRTETDVPLHVAEREEHPEEIGASHGEVKGTWRIVRNGVLGAIVVLAVAWAFFL